MSEAARPAVGITLVLTGARVPRTSFQARYGRDPPDGAYADGLHITDPRVGRTCATGWCAEPRPTGRASTGFIEAAPWHGRRNARPGAPRSTRRSSTALAVALARSDLTSRAYADVPRHRDGDVGPSRATSGGSTAAPPRRSASPASPCDDARPREHGAARPPRASGVERLGDVRIPGTRPAGLDLGADALPSPCRRSSSRRRSPHGGGAPTGGPRDHLRLAEAEAGRATPRGSATTP